MSVLPCIACVGFRPDQRATIDAFMSRTGLSVPGLARKLQRLTEAATAAPVAHDCASIHGLVASLGPAGSLLGLVAPAENLVLEASPVRAHRSFSSSSSSSSPSRASNGGDSGDFSSTSMVSTRAAVDLQRLQQAKEDGRDHVRDRAGNEDSLDDDCQIIAVRPIARKRSHLSPSAFRAGRHQKPYIRVKPRQPLEHGSNVAGQIQEQNHSRTPSLHRPQEFSSTQPKESQPSYSRMTPYLNHQHMLTPPRQRDECDSPTPPRQPQQPDLTPPLQRHEQGYFPMPLLPPMQELTPLTPSHLPRDHSEQHYSQITTRQHRHLDQTPHLHSDEDSHRPSSTLHRIQYKGFTPSQLLHQEHSLRQDSETTSQQHKLPRLPTPPPQHRKESSPKQKEQVHQNRDIEQTQPPVVLEPGKLPPIVKTPLEADFAPPIYAGQNRSRPTRMSGFDISYCWPEVTEYQLATPRSGDAGRGPAQ